LGLQATQTLKGLLGVNHREFDKLTHNFDTFGADRLLKATHNKNSPATDSAGTSLDRGSQAFRKQ
jgi:hypothetical protein